MVRARNRFLGALAGAFAVFAFATASVSEEITSVTVNKEGDTYRSSVTATVDSMPAAVRAILADDQAGPGSLP